MSLRLRFTLTVAAMAALATLFATTMSYRSTAQRLDRAVDESLVNSGNRLAEQMDRHGSRKDRGRQDNDGRDLRGRRNSRTVGEDGPIAPGVAPAEGPAFGADRIPSSELIAMQWISVVGAVTVQPNVELPVDDTDRRIAKAEARTETIRTVDIGTSTYRVRTIGVPGEGAVQVARDVTENQSVMRDLLKRFALLVAGTSAAAALMSWMLARQATKRLLHLERVVTAMATTGDLTPAEPLQTSGSDETAKVATAFEKLVSALATSREQQHRLIEDASHELRTPLTSLRTNMSLLPKLDQLSIPDRQNLLADVHSEVEELVLLVNELVEHATDSGSDEPTESVGLKDIADRCAAVIRRRSGRNITVTGDDSVVMAGPIGVARAITNLLGNAVKFDNTNSSIQVTVVNGVVRVRDHGPGIAEDDLSRIFDRFYRSEAARSQPGSGLGLSIVADVARRWGGTASAVNAVGGGAELTLQLPPIR
jgi:two-component system, OmpR family, sensor histidine kinase MprB